MKHYLCIFKNSIVNTFYTHMRCRISITLIMKHATFAFTGHLLLYVIGIKIYKLHDSERFGDFKGIFKGYFKKLEQLFVQIPWDQ